MAIDQSSTASSPGSSRSSLLAGGSILAVAMFAANGGNYLLNVALGRWLSTAEFADANLMVTLMLLVTAIAVSLQLIAARFAGLDAARSTHHEPSPNHAGLGDPVGLSPDTAALARGLRRIALVVGAALAVVLAVGSPFWAELFNSASPWPFVVLGMGMPAYLVQAVGRGVLQGNMRFAELAATFMHEAAARLVLGLALVALGLGVVGATIALTASFVVTWASVERALGWDLRAVSPSLPPDVVAYATPVGLLLLGQIIINNGDVLISKQSLDPTNAGIYAAIALVGRAVFFLSWSVATTLFPAATQRREQGRNAHELLYAGIAAVAAMGTVAVIGARLLGGFVLGHVFGPDYAGVSGPLGWYALATSVFAVANLIVSHHLALGELREAIVMVAGAILQTVLLLGARGSIDQLIQAQVVAMLILAAAVSISHVGRRFSERNELELT